MRADLRMMAAAMGRVLALAGMAGFLLAAGSAHGEPSGHVPEAHYTDAGADGCMRCHAGDSIVVILETPHGDQTNPYAPFGKNEAGCEACHGPGSLHVSRARGGAGFPPLARFGRDGETVAEQLDICLGCHSETMGEHPGMAFRGSLHDTGRMTCSNCHTIHDSGIDLASRDAQITNCATCHDEQIENHQQFAGRGIVFDQLTCHDCHDVHQLKRRQ